MVAALADVDTVLNCAGPFAQTAPAWIAACLAARVNYLDITGELDVIELAAQHHEHARPCRRDADAGRRLRRGADRLPGGDAGRAIARRGSFGAGLCDGWPASRGTAKTVLAAMPAGGRVRIAGRIETGADGLEVAADSVCRSAALGE